MKEIQKLPFIAVIAVTYFLLRSSVAFAASAQSRTEPPGAVYEYYLFLQEGQLYAREKDYPAALKAYESAYALRPYDRRVKKKIDQLKKLAGAKKTTLEPDKKSIMQSVALSELRLALRPAQQPTAHLAPDLKEPQPLDSATLNPRLASFIKKTKEYIRLTLEESVNMALVNAEGELAGAQYDLLVAREALNAIYADYGLKSTLTYTNSFAYTKTTPITSDKSVSITQTSEEAASLSKKFLLRKLGSTLDVQTMATVSGAKNQPGTTYGDTTTSSRLYTVTPSATATYTQPLTKDGILAGSATVVSGERSFTNAELNLELTRQTVILSTITAYYNFMKAKDTVKVAEAELASTENLISSAQAKLGAGLIPELDVMTLKVKLAQNKSSLMNALNDRDNALDSFFIKLGLNKVYGRESFDKLMVELNESIQLPKVTLSLKECIAEALKNRIETAQSDLALKNAKLAVSVAKSTDDPSMTVTGTSTWDRTSKSVSESISKLKQEHTWGAQAQVTYPWLDGGAAGAAVRSALESLRKAEWTRRRLQENIANEINQYYETVLSNKDQLDTLQQSLDLAETVLTISKVKYQNGSNTIEDVINAQNSLVTTATSIKNKKADYLIACFNLAKAMGLIENYLVDYIKGESIDARE